MISARERERVDPKLREALQQRRKRRIRRRLALRIADLVIAVDKFRSGGVGSVSDVADAFERLRDYAGQGAAGRVAELVRRRLA